MHVLVIIAETAQRFLVKLEKEDSPKCPKCKGSMESMLKPLIKSGKIEGKLPEVDGIRKYVLEQISKLDL